MSGPVFTDDSRADDGESSARGVLNCDSSDIELKNAAEVGDVDITIIDPADPHRQTNSALRWAMDILEAANNDLIRFDVSETIVSDQHGHLPLKSSVDHYWDGAKACSK